jgi:hypothetical protein
VLLAGLTVASPAAWAERGSADDFTVYGKFTDFDYDDNGKDGKSKGDVLTFAYDLYERGGQAGAGDGTCVITELDRADHDFAADCEQTFHLDGGTIDMEGTVTDEDFRNGEVVMDIVDGTGDYRDAGGTVTFTKAGDHKENHGQKMGTNNADSSDRGKGGHGFLAHVDLD